MKLTPACYQDLLDGKTLYHRARKDRGVYEFLEILPGHGQQCASNMAGESFLMGWRWKDCPDYGSQGHLPVARYKTASDFRLERQLEPMLYVKVIEQDRNSQIAQ
jgi:hypothetical protein